MTYPVVASDVILVPGPTGPQGEKGEKGDTGEGGPPGPAGGGTQSSIWKWKAAAVDDPVTLLPGQIAVNAANPRDATKLYMHRLDATDGIDWGIVFAALNPSDQLYLQAKNDGGSWHRYDCDSYPFNAQVLGGSPDVMAIWVTTDDGSPQGSEPTDGADVWVMFTIMPTQGPPGETGPQGPPGPQGPQGLPGSGVAWRGIWSSATSYVVGDAVYYAGSSYIATTANTNTPPGNFSSFTIVADQAPTAVTNTGSVAGISQQFTPTTTMNVNGITVRRESNSVSGVIRVGISAVLPTTLDPIWLGYGDTDLTGLNINTDRDVVLNAPITLTSGGTYYMVIIQGGGNVNGLQGNSAPNATNMTLSTWRMNNGSSWSTVGAVFQTFRLKFGTGAWDLMAKGA